MASRVLGVVKRTSTPASRADVNSDATGSSKVRQLACGPHGVSERSWTTNAVVVGSTVIATGSGLGGIVCAAATALVREVASSPRTRAATAGAFDFPIIFRLLFLSGVPIRHALARGYLRFAVFSGSPRLLNCRAQIELQMAHMLLTCPSPRPHPRR